MGFLEDVIERKQDEVASRRRVLPAGALAPHPSVSWYSLRESLTREGIRIIAEIKRRSPTKPDLTEGADIVSIAHAYSRGGAAAISVLTDEEAFGGSLSDLQTVRDEIALPILRKDFLVDDYQILEAASVGANAVLLIVAALEDAQLKDMVAFALEQRVEPLVEVHDEDELERAVAAGARVVGINNRNLKTLEVDLDTCRRLLPKIPEGIVAVAESGYDDYSQLHELQQEGAHAFLIGSSLMSSEDPAQKLKALQGFLF